MTDFKMSTDFNYQKTALNQQDTITISAASSASKSFTHDLGYIPSARVWYDPNSDGTWYPLANVQLLEGFTGLDTNGYYYLTTSAVVVTLFDATGSTNNCPVIVRVYYDD